MTALDTSLRLLASAGITGAMFALPLGLAMAWKADLPELQVETTAAPMVALAAVPFALAPTDGLGGESSEPATPGSDTSGATDSGAPSGAAARGEARPSTLVAGGSHTVGTGRRINPKAAPVPVAKKKKKARACATPNPGIVRDEGSSWTVDRDIVDAYAKKPGTLGKLGYVSRHEGSDGKADGFRVGGITCGNDLHAAGFRNGDVVHSVNGKKITSIPEALWAYGTLRKADELEVKLSRKGTVKVLRFSMKS